MKNRFTSATGGLLTEAYGQGLSVVNRRRSNQVIVALVVGAALALPSFAEAQTVTGGSSPATMINNICTFILGPFGQSLAVLGIIAIGLSWMFGRVSLGLIAGVIGGIVIMFGASYLGSTLTGGTGG
jgi:type IV secretory pathway VirB2 component (pilin)